MEKVKEIRQSFAKAVVSGNRSESGKIVYEFYDKLVLIWGGSANTEPTSYPGSLTSALRPTLRLTPSLFHLVSLQIIFWKTTTSTIFTMTHWAKSLNMRNSYYQTNAIKWMIRIKLPTLQKHLLLPNERETVFLS